MIFGPFAVAVEMAPFAIPGGQNPDSLIAMPYEPIAVGSSRITAAGDHFVRDGERIRIWGVNLAFGGNLPSHADAPMAAERLAAAGVNAVRCHHLDTLNYPSGIWNPTNGQTIYPEAMDRLDYFINELAGRGIYINLNLHVGRAHSQYIGWPDPGTDYDKIAGIFTQALIDAQKSYAQQMLSHVNPYRGVRYADDPAIAFVEITNEDSFFMWNGDEVLRNLPSYYAALLKHKYNEWLHDEYEDTNNLRSAWNANVEPLGPNVITSFEEHFSNPGANRWVLEEHSGCDANFQPGIYDGNTAAKFTILVTDGTNWHLQVKHPKLQLTEEQYYTLSFKAAAEGPRTIWCSVMQDHDPWSNLGFSRTVDLTNQWQMFTFGFTANADDLNGRVNIAFGGGDTTTFYLDDVELRTGGQVGLLADESIETGTVRLFVDTEVKERTIDRMRFLAETEKAYFDQMRNYIKSDLGCQALVTGTIVFGPLGLYAQSDMDFIDSHAYWQHPVFPGIPWDPANWYIEQRSMVDYIDQATLFGLAGCRLGKGPSHPGKPFTVSEYNHSAPLDSQASCVPMIASFAAAQDWDGVWLYSYTHKSNAWDANLMDGFFDIMHNPAKWGFVPSGAAVFREGAIGPVGDTYSCRALTDANETVTGLAELHLSFGSDMFGVLVRDSSITRQDLLKKRIVSTMFETATIPLPDEPNDTTINWTVAGDGNGIYIAAGNSAWVGVGHHDRFSAATNGTVEVNEPDFAALMITPTKPGPAPAILAGRSCALIAACGRCENTGMIFSPDRSTVGTNWGTAPVQIEPVEATIWFPFKGLSCYALKPDGTIRSTVPVGVVGGRTRVEVSPAYGTMWYLVTVSGDVDGDGDVNFEDFSKIGQYWLADEPSVDIAPLPFGDGIVDYKDLSVLTNTWLLGAGP